MENGKTLHSNFTSCFGFTNSQCSLVETRKLSGGNRVQQVSQFEKNFKKEPDLIIQNPNFQKTAALFSKMFSTNQIRLVRLLKLLRLPTKISGSKNLLVEFYGDTKIYRYTYGT